jgi:hypothetical protein
MRDNRRFQSGSSVYKCEGCGNMTRETGECESGVGLCKQCYYEAGTSVAH